MKYKVADSQDWEKILSKLRKHRLALTLEQEQIIRDIANKLP
jgi:hypothetical protein